MVGLFADAALHLDNRVMAYLVGISVMGCIALAAYASGFDLGKYEKRYTRGFTREIVKADLPIGAQDFALGLAVGGAILWLVAIAVLRQSIMITLIALPAVMAVVLAMGVIYLRLRGFMRLRKFSDQLELVLRTLSGALRVGVSFRQALVLAADEMPDPARREFRRVIGRTNIGIPLVDAIEEMAKTNPGNDLMLFVRCVRVQSQTGGDLASVFETLAATIRDRRRVRRKMNALTSQGRFGAFIIGALPVLVGGFVVGTQPDMRDALFYTLPGIGCLGGVAVLEALAIFTLLKILQLDV
jgi:tight adherence protein B